MNFFTKKKVRSLLTAPLNRLLLPVIFYNIFYILDT